MRHFSLSRGFHSKRKDITHYLLVENRYFYGKSEPYVCITISYFRKFVKGRKARTYLAAPPNAKADGGGFDTGEKLCRSPSRKSGLHAAPCHDVPCCVLVPRTDSTLPLSSSHRAEREEGRRHCHRSLLYEKPGSRPCPGCRTRRLYPSVHRWRRSDRSPKPRAF